MATRQPPPDGGTYTYLPTSSGGTAIVTQDGVMVGWLYPDGTYDDQVAGVGKQVATPEQVGYIRSQNDDRGKPITWQEAGQAGYYDTGPDDGGVRVAAQDPILYGDTYGKDANQVAYEQWALNQGVAMANRDDNRYALGTSGLTASPAAAGYVNLGTTPQSAGVSLGSAPQVNLTNLGSAPQVGRVDMGIADQMGRVQLGPAAQADQVNLGSASTAQRVQLGDAATANRVDLGNAAQMGRTDMGAAQTADLYTTDFTGAFNPSQAAYGYAGQLNDYATNIDGSYIQDAAEMQRLAAMGLAPSAAENMYLQGGIDTQYALDRAAQQTQFGARRSIDDLVRDQLSQAARARGSSGMGLATMNAQNQAALGSARITSEAINQLQQNNMAYINAGQTAYNQAALTRANEMAQARSAYGDRGQAIRAGDFQGAQNALALAQGYQGIDAAYLAAAQQNNDLANANSQFNATNLNAFAQAQAQLDASRNEANMNAQNQLRAQQGQLDSALNQYNATNANQFALSQAELDAARNQYNASTLNDWRMNQGQLAQQNNQYNATNLQNSMLQQAQMDAARNEANMLANNQWAAQQAQLDAARNQFNASTASEYALSQAELDQQARLYNATNLQNQAFQQGQLSQQNNQYNANLAQQQQFQQAQLSQGTNQFNAGQANQVVQQNLDRVAGIQQGNQQAAIQAGQADDQFLGNTLAMGQNQQNAAWDARMRGAETQQAFVSQNADRTANFLTGNATNAIARKQAENQQTASWIGAGAAALGTIVAAASDRRLKNAEGKAPPADFTGAGDHVYSYKHGYGQEPGLHIGPMADELPEDVIRVKDGYKHVDVARLALREAGALGNLQKRVAQLEARK